MNSDRGSLSRYARLFDVRVSHGYYSPDQALPWLLVNPTPQTKRTLDRLGLKIDTHARGFMVAYDERRRAALLRFAAEQPGTSLKFALGTRAPFIINATAVPLATNLSRTIFSLGNHNATALAPRLSEAPRVSGLDARPITGSSFPVELPLDCHMLEVDDDAGGRVASIEARGKDVVFVDLSGEPMGRYTLRFFGRGYTEVAASRELVLLIQRPPPLCLVELRLASPRSSGLYPIDADATTISATNYELAFASRATTWRYLITSSPRERYERMWIEVTSPSDVAFEAEEPVELANGQRAHCFRSTRALHLRSRTSYDFTLKAERRFRGEQTLIQRLPVASPAQVFGPGEGQSNVYVHV